MKIREVVLIRIKYESRSMTALNLHNFESHLEKTKNYKYKITHWTLGVAQESEG